MRCLGAPARLLGPLLLLLAAAAGVGCAYPSADTAAPQIMAAFDERHPEVAATRRRSARRMALAPQVRSSPRASTLSYSACSK
jgi:hypothetical protein